MDVKENLIFCRKDTEEQKKLLLFSYELLIRKAENNNYKKWLTK